MSIGWAWCLYSQSLNDSILTLHKVLPEICKAGPTTFLLAACDAAIRSRIHFDSTSTLTLSLLIFTRWASIRTISPFAWSTFRRPFFLLFLTIRKSTLKPLDESETLAESPIDSPLCFWYQCHLEIIIIRALPLAPQISSPKVFSSTAPQIFTMRSVSVTFTSSSKI